MYLKNIELCNFRNITTAKLNFNKKINIFIGNNAQGKTNILESIYFLAITKSHRTHTDLNLIKKDELYTRVCGTYTNDSNSYNLSILLNSKGKKVSVDNVVQSKISNYLSRFNVIMFCPDDLEIIKGRPSVRRKYLNIELSQFRNDYLIYLKEYNQILKQRNEYLKQKSNYDFNKIYFNVLTDKLVDLNIKIIKNRYAFINKINMYLKDIFYTISGYNNLFIKYNSFIAEKDLKNDELKNMVLSKYNSIFNNEIIQKTTLIGCHKDDFKLCIDNLDITEYGSQGQQRLSVLCLKLAELEVFKNEKNTNPIILLDDIFSELDEIKKNNIIKYFKDDIQIFITTTDIKDINKELKDKSDIYIVDNGTFVKEE